MFNFLKFFKNLLFLNVIMPDGGGASADDYSEENNPLDNSKKLLKIQGDKEYSKTGQGDPDYNTITWGFANYGEGRNIIIGDINYIKGESFLILGNDNILNKNRTDGAAGNIILGSHNNDNLLYASYINGFANSNNEMEQASIYGNGNKNNNLDQASIYGCGNKNNELENSLINGYSNSNNDLNQASIYGCGNENNDLYNSILLGNGNENNELNQASIFGNSNNNNDLYNSILLGDGNENNKLENSIGIKIREIEAEYSLILGSSNQKGKYRSSIVCGFGHKSEDFEGGIIFGYNNKVNGETYSLIGGIHSNFKDNEEIIACGVGLNIIDCSSSLITGFSENSANQCSGIILAGYGNEVEDTSAALITSWSTKIKEANGSIIGGGSNEVSGECSIINGLNSVIQAEYSVINTIVSQIKNVEHSLIVGCCLNVDQSTLEYNKRFPKFVFGRKNDDKKNTFVEIANDGNIFEIDKDTGATTCPKLEISDIQDPKTLVTKEYVDNKSTSISYNIYKVPLVKINETMNIFEVNVESYQKYSTFYIEINQETEYSRIRINVDTNPNYKVLAMKFTDKEKAKNFIQNYKRYLIIDSESIIAKNFDFYLERTLNDYLNYINNINNESDFDDIIIKFSLQRDILYTNSEELNNAIYIGLLWIGSGTDQPTSK